MRLPKISALLTAVQPALAALSAMLVASQAGATTYTVVDVGPPSPSCSTGEHYVAFGGTLNSHGSVALQFEIICSGSPNDGQVSSYMYNPSTGKDTSPFAGVSYRDLYAQGLNNAGQMAGTYVPAGGTYGHPFYWDGKKFTDLFAVLLPGTTSAGALAINGSGAVIGDWVKGTTAPQQFGGFIYQRGKVTDLATKFRITDTVYPAAINDRGEIVGSTFPSGTAPPGSVMRAFLWNTAKVIYLGTLSASFGDTMTTGINLYGDVVGWSPSTAGNDHAFLYKNSKMSDLGVPPGGYDHSYGYALNNYDDVVGSSYYCIMISHHESCVTSAVIVPSGGTMENLNDLIASTDLLHGKVNLEEATSINDAGQIVADGYYADGRGASVFLLTSSNAKVATR